MRTRADLDGAFALLERAADTYADAHPAASEPVDLLPATARRRGLMHRPLTVLAAAATIVAVAAGAALAIEFTSTSGAAPSGGGPSPHEVARTIDFTLAPALHMTIGEVQVDSQTGTTAQLFSRDQHYELDVRAAFDGSQVAEHGVQRVDIGGEDGYYSDGSGPGLILPDYTPPQDRSTSPAPVSYGKFVFWQYAPHAWASVIGQGFLPDEAQLLHVARGIRFGGTHVVRSPIAVRSMPKGMFLADYDVTYGSVGDLDVPPYVNTSTHWDFMASYDRSGGGNGLYVEAFHDAAKHVDAGQVIGGTRVDVGTRVGYWSAKQHELLIVLGSDTYAAVGETGERPTLAMNQVVQFAVSLGITLTPDPQRPATWYDLRKALPEHS